jgi:hypothetical protein
MFFPILISAPILVGLVTGVWTPNRRAPWALCALCLTLGVVGAIVSAFNADARESNIIFSLGAGLVCAGLAWAGYGLGRISRTSVRRA